MSEPMARNAHQAALNKQALDTEHLMTSIGRRAASGGLIALGAQAIRMVLALVTSAIMARLLAPQDFGLVAMAATVTGFVILFADAGLSVGTVQRKDIDQDTISSLFYFNVFTGCVAMLTAFACAPLAAWLFADKRVLWLVVALALVIPLSTAGAQHSALLLRGMRWRTAQAIGIAGQLVGSVAGILVAWRTDAGYWALVVTAWTIELTNLLLVWLLCPWRPNLVFRWPNVRAALDFGLGLTGFNVLNYFHRQLDNLLVGAVWGATELGYYTRAYGLFMLPLTAFTRPLGSAIEPAMSRLQAEPARWRALYLTSIAGITFIAAPLAGLLFTFAEPIILLIFGSQWTPAVPIFQALAFSMLVQPVYSSGGWVYISLGRTRRLLSAGVVATVWYCCAFIIGVQFGALGVAIAYACASVLLTPIWLWWAVRETALSPADIAAVVWPPIACTFVAYGVVTLLPSLRGHLFLDTAVHAAAFAVVYASCAAFAWFHLPAWQKDTRPALEHARTLLPWKL